MRRPVHLLSLEIRLDPLEISLSVFRSTRYITIYQPGIPTPQGISHLHFNIQCQNYQKAYTSLYLHRRGQRALSRLKLSSSWRYFIGLLMGGGKNCWRIGRRFKRILIMYVPSCALCSCSVFCFPRREARD